MAARVVHERTRSQLNEYNTCQSSLKAAAPAARLYEREPELGGNLPLTCRQSAWSGASAKLQEGNELTRLLTYTPRKCRSRFAEHFYAYGRREFRPVVSLLAAFASTIFHRSDLSTRVRLIINAYTTLPIRDRCCYLLLYRTCTSVALFMPVLFLLENSRCSRVEGMSEEWMIRVIRRDSNLLTRGLHLTHFSSSLASTS